MQTASFLVYICTVFRKSTRHMTKFNLQIITAAVLAVGGLALLFCGVYIEPHGEIHESLLIGFGEVATFAGALFGIDAAYSKKLWDITNSFAKKQDPRPNDPTTPRTPSEEHSTASNTATPARLDSTKSTLLALPPHSKTPTA